MASSPAQSRQSPANSPFSTIVGYQNRGVTNGVYNFLVSTFERVDGTTMTLGDIGVDGDYISSSLSFLTPSAGTKKFEIGGQPGLFGFVYYFEADLEETPYAGKPGWYYELEGTLYPFNDFEVPYGTMFYLEGAEDCNVVFNGSVLQGADQPIEVKNGVYNFTGNCTPVDLTLGDIGVNDDYISSSLSFLTTSAGTKKFEIGGQPGLFGFVYYFESDLEETPYAGQPGWYYELEGTLYPFNDYALPAGSMFYLEGAEDCEVIIPAAIK